jgi:hypothetical protein
MPRRVIVDIRRNELHTHRSDFWPWELPLLQFIHKGDVKEVGEHDVENRVLDPEQEFERLERRYGFDKETHKIRVHEVYGNPPLGVQKLAEAMQGHLDEQAETDARKAAELDAEAAAAEAEAAAAAEQQEPAATPPGTARPPAGEPAEDVEQPRSRRRASS